MPPWTLTIAVSIIILYLTLVPRPVPADLTEPFPGADKIVHGIMFASLAAAIVIDKGRSVRTVPSRTIALTAALISTISGALIELLQLWMDMGRGCEMTDFIADTIGAFTGGWIGIQICRWLHKP